MLDYGPTDVPHPLLTSVHRPFDLLYALLKRASIEEKLIASSCNTRMRLSMSVQISMHACRSSL